MHVYLAAISRARFLQILHVCSSLASTTPSSGDEGAFRTKAVQATMRVHGPLIDARFWRFVPAGTNPAYVIE